VDIVSANSGLFIPEGPAHLVSESHWQTAIDINLTGVWHTVKVAIPQLLEQGTGGSIVLTSSTSGHKGTPNAAGYSSAKHGVIGLMRTLAMELGPYNIRVNSLHMTTVLTPMLQNQGVYDMYRPDLEKPSEEDTAEVFKLLHLLPIPWVEPVDVSNALLFLASDESRYVTGTELKVDAGNSIK
jgi:NAD(P)-dependent dehydrogenase (short-subunit alcohol dehydrogenase family)